MANYQWTFEAKGAANAAAMNTALLRLDATIKTLTQTTVDFKSAFNTIGDAFTGATQRARQATDAFTNVGKSRAADGMRQTAGAAGLLGNALQAAATSGGGFGGALTAAAGVIPGYGQAIMVASQALGKFTDAAKSAYDAIMKVGVPVDSMKGQLQALLSPADLANGKFEEMTAKAKELSLLPGIEQSDIYSGFIALSKAGNNATDAIAKMPAALRVAQAESRSIESAAQDVSVAWNIFGDSLRKTGKDFSYTAAILSAGALSSPIKDVTELTRGVQKSGGVMKIFNLGLEDNITLMGMLATQNYRGAEAGRALKAIMNRLASDNKDVTKTLEQLGIKMADSQGKFREFPVILDELKVALGSVSDEMRVKMQKALAGENYNSQFQALVDMGGGAFRELRENIINNLGSLENQQKAKINSMQGAVELFVSNWNNVKITFSEILRIPIVAWWSTLGDAVGKFGGRLDKLSADFQTAIKKLDPEGKNPFEAWIQALQDFDWSGIWDEIASTIQPVIDLVLKLSYNAASAFQKWLVASMPKIILQIGKFALQTAWSIAREAVLYAIRLFENAALNILSKVKGIFNFFTGKKTAEQPTDAKTAETPSIQQENADTADDMEEVAEIQARLNEEKEKERDINAELNASAEKRKKALEDEQVARAAILQQMNAALTAEQAMQLAGSDQGKALAERFTAEQQRKTQADTSDRAKALLLNGQGMPFNTAMQTAKQDRLKGESLDVAATMIQQAQKVASSDRNILENEKKQAETTAAIQNAPIEGQMQVDKTENAWQKYILEPLNIFQQRFKETIEKFSAAFENIGKKRIDVRTKAGIIDEAGAKKESEQLLDRSIKQGEEALKIAQTPAEKAAALETLAGKQAEMADITGKKTGYEKADELLKRAQVESEKAKDVEMQKTKLDQELAKKNVSNLANMKDSSASGAAARLQQLLEAQMQLGDVSGAATTKEALQNAQRAAASEQTNLLKQQILELQLIRKALGIESEKTRLESKDIGLRSLDTLKRIQSEGGSFDPALALPMPAF